MTQYPKNDRTVNESASALALASVLPSQKPLHSLLIRSIDKPVLFLLLRLGLRLALFAPLAPLAPYNSRHGNCCRAYGRSRAIVRVRRDLLRLLNTRSILRLLGRGHRHVLRRLTYGARLHRDALVAIAVITDGGSAVSKLAGSMGILLLLEAGFRRAGAYLFLLLLLEYGQALRLRWSRRLTGRQVAADVEVRVARIWRLGVLARGCEGEFGLSDGCIGGYEAAVHGLDADIGRQGCDGLLPRFPVLGPYRYSRDLAVGTLLPLNWACGDCPRTALSTGRFPMQRLFYCRLEDGHHAELEVELPAVFLRDVGRINILFECRFHVRGGENKDFGDGDGVEPSLDPAPDGGEECGCTNDLVDGS